MECSWGYWFSVQSKKMHHKNTQDTEQMRDVFNSFYRAAELSFDNLQTLIFNLCIFGAGRNLIQWVVWNTFPFCFFFIQGDIKAVWQGVIVINLQVLPFWHFPCWAWGKRQVMQYCKGCYACKGRHECMHAVGFWQRKACSTTSWPSRACVTWLL